MPVLHVPARQVPVQLACAQHTPPMQLPLAHSAPLAHPPPLPARHIPPPEQLYVGAHWLLVVQLV
jgi:hypothetical protein